MKPTIFKAMKETLRELSIWIVSWVAFLLIFQFTALSQFNQGALTAIFTVILNRILFKPL